MTRKLCLQRLSHFLQSSLHCFLPRSSRKNADFLLSYFGIRGITDTSLSLPNCRFAPEMRKRPKPAPSVWFRGDFGSFFRYDRLHIGGSIFTVRHSKAAVCRFRVTKKRRISTTLLSCSKAYLIFNHHCRCNHILNCNGFPVPRTFRISTVFFISLSYSARSALRLRSHTAKSVSKFGFNFVSSPCCFSAVRAFSPFIV